MLYVTTRSKNDAFTVYRTIHQDRGPDGGLFLPMRMPAFSAEEVSALATKTFGQNVAEILNLFFGTNLTGWDVDMAIGRYPTALHSMHHRTLICELWHNEQNRFDYAVEALAKRLRPVDSCMASASDWVQMTVRIAVLFGVFGDLLRRGQVDVEHPLDVVVTSGSFSAPMAAWYARFMGLPIGTIICGCNENGAIWDLFHRGEVDTDALTIPTSTPDADFGLPPALERLISAVLGFDEAARYSWICAEGGTYTPPEGKLDDLKNGMFAAVVSGARVNTIISSVYRTNRYILNPYSALAYGALSDYRSRTGFGGAALLLTERSPLCNAQFVAKTMNITPDELTKRMEEM